MSVPTVVQQPELFDSMRSVSFSTRDIDEMRDRISRQYCDHHLDPVGRQHMLAGCYATVPMGNLSINFLRYGTDIAIDVGDFGDFYMVEFPLSGSVEVSYGQEAFLSSGPNGIVISPGRYVKSRWSADCSQIMLKIDKEPLHQYLRTMLMTDIREPVVFQPSININHGAGQSIFELLQYLIRQSKNDDSLFQSPLVLKEMENTVLSILLNRQPHNYSEPVSLRNRRILPKMISKAYDYIREHAHEPIGIKELVAVTHVSERTLYAGFKSFVGASPLSCIRTCRLERARSRLESAEPSATVANIARECGFLHLGRFSNEYRKQFGEYPSETLGRCQRSRSDI